MTADIGGFRDLVGRHIEDCGGQTLFRPESGYIAVGGTGVGAVVAGGRGENGEGDPAVCYHMKCEECGSLIHLECDAITELEDHIWKDHRFRVDPGRTVFYGLCEECEKKGYEESAQERKLER